MNLANPPTAQAESSEVAALVEILLNTGQRLEELTAGRVDTVADRHGRTLALQWTQDQVRQSEMAKQAAILNAIPSHIALIDARGVILAVNEAWLHFEHTNAMQGRPGYAVGLNYIEICDSAQEQGAKEAHLLAGGIRSVLAGLVEKFSMEFACGSPSDRQWFLLTVTPLEGDVPSGAVVMHLNITDRKQAALEALHLAQHDFLTGLPNRSLLNDRIEQALISARRHANQVAVLFLDLDGFKHINDSLGHRVGDKVLQLVSKRLEDCIRAPDTVSRQGGDEFVVLLSEIRRPEDAAIAARRVLGAMTESVCIDLHELHMSTSIGISVYPEDGLDADTLIKNADIAMYRAKENGRQSFRFFTPEMTLRAVERQFMEEHLCRAIERKEFTLHYQPKVDLKTGAAVGAEALMRWTHPERGAISPAEFIPIAEECGLILPIGLWALDEACRQARAWTDAGLPSMTMAVNVSAVQFQNDNFLDDIFSTLDHTGFNPALLELEVTEGLLMKRVALTAAILQTLRERGIRIAIDDFGTGYSSLSYLHKFPIDSLKIDQSFVREITSSPEGASIVSTIIHMGRNLKLRIIAEGVETAPELAFLQAQDCHEAQGYFFSRAVPPDQFAKLIEKQCLTKMLSPQHLPSVLSPDQN